MSWSVQPGDVSKAMRTSEALVGASGVGQKAVLVLGPFINGKPPSRPAFWSSQVFARCRKTCPSSLLNYLLTAGGFGRVINSSQVKLERLLQDLM